MKDSRRRFTPLAEVAAQFAGVLCIAWKLRALFSGSRRAVLGLSSSPCLVGTSVL